MRRRARAVPTGRLRRRLAIAFLLVGGLSAAALAAGSYLVVRHNLLDDSVDASLAQARSNFAVAPTYLRKRRGEERLLAALERRGEFLTLIVHGHRSFSSSFSLSPRSIPRDLRRLVARGDLGWERKTFGSVHYVAVGGRTEERDLYFFFPEEDVWDELSQLRTILLAGLGVLALLSAVVGALLARGLLAPVGRASAAARSLAEGLLDTRLPTERTDEFGAWAASFNEMAAALEAKIEALSEAEARERRFTADVAHELRTPLTALVGEASLLSSHLDRMPDEARRPAELLVADVSRLRRLVDDLMEISRLDAGSESVRAEPFDLAALVASTVRTRGWDGVRVAAGPLPVASDPRRVERIVANLIGNAVEHGGDAVFVRVERQGDEALVDVTDRGPGIPPEQLPHLFDRFYKADAARSSRGSGLGLAIARENARLLGGDVVVRSTPGEGARFTLRLPVTQPLPPGEGAVAAAAQDGMRQPGRETP